MLQEKVLCKYAKEFWNYSWKRKTSLLSETCFTFQELLQKTQDKFWNIYSWKMELSYQKQMVFVFEGKKEGIFLKALCDYFWVLII